MGAIRIIDHEAVAWRPEMTYADNSGSHARRNLKRRGCAAAILSFIRDKGEFRHEPKKKESICGVEFDPGGGFAAAHGWRQSGAGGVWLDWQRI
jgi:hypothetical protein